MIDELTLISVIAKLDLQPDDIVVLKSHRPLTMEGARRIEEYFKARLQLQNRIVILDGLDIEILSPTQTHSSREVAGH